MTDDFKLAPLASQPTAAVELGGVGFTISTLCGFPHARGLQPCLTGFALPNPVYCFYDRIEPAVNIIIPHYSTSFRNNSVIVLEQCTAVVSRLSYLLY
jgi:hypothetical protein